MSSRPVRISTQPSTIRHNGRVSITSPTRTSIPTRIGASTHTFGAHPVTSASHVYGGPGASYLQGARFVNERVVGVHQNALPARVVGGTIPQLRTHVNAVETFQDEPIVHQNIVEKQVEIVREQRVPYQTYVDVPYDVYVEKPIEKIIQKEINIEKYVDVPYERIVEVPVEKIVEVPVERIVHHPVEYIKNVEVPYETIVQREVPQPVENVVFHDREVSCNVENLHLYPGAIQLPTEVVVHQQERLVERPIYVDNIIQQTVDVPIERIIQVPVERVVEHPIEHIVEKPVYIDNIIEREVQVPVEKIVEVPVEHIVERPVYIDNIIERPIPIEVIREETIEIPVEHIVEKPIYIDNIIEKPVEVIIENPVPIEKIIEIPVAQHIETNLPVEEVTANAYDIVREIPVQIDTVTRLPIEYVVRKDVPVPVESIVELDIPVCRANVHEKIIERPVEWERITQKPVPVEKIVEVEVERVTENPVYVEKIIEVRVPHDRIIESTYDVIVQNIVEVPVEKIITVPIKTFTQVANEHRIYYEKDINVVSTVVQPVPGLETEDHFEVHDQLLADKTADNVSRIQALAHENAQLRAEAASLNVDHTPQFNALTAHNANLKSELSELESRLNIVDKDTQRLATAVNSRTIQHINYTVPHPSTGGLANQLDGLVHANKALTSQAAAHGDLEAHIKEANLAASLQGPVVLPTTQGLVHSVVASGPVRRSPRVSAGIIHPSPMRPIATSFVRHHSPSPVRVAHCL